MNIGIVGAGALGTLFGWHFAGAHDVCYLDIREDVCATIAAHGVRVDDKPARAARAMTTPAAIFGSDIIFVFVKAPDTLRALRPFAGQLNPSMPIVSLQNGVDNERAIKTAIGGTVALAIGATSEAAVAISDGVSQRLGIGTTVLGSGGASPTTVERVATLFTTCGLDARSAYDIRPHLWGKLLVNAAINPITALLDRENGVILADPDAGALSKTLAEEAAAVCAALRIKLPFSDPWAYVKEIASATRSVRNSMSIDLAAGRPTEIDAINGALAATGRRVGVPAPANDAMMRLVKARERLGSS